MGVEVVSIMEFSGDPEELMSKMGTVEEVASRKAAEYGGVSSTAVRTDDGIMIIVGIVGVILAFTVLGWIFHTLIFLAKVVLVAAVAGLAFRFFAGRR